MSRARVGHIYEATFHRATDQGSVPWTGNVLVLSAGNHARDPIHGAWLYDVLVSAPDGELFTIDDYSFFGSRMKRLT